MLRNVRKLFTSSADLMKKIDHYASFSPRPLTLKKFLDFAVPGVGIDGTQRNSCIFLRNELPVRLARLLKIFDYIEPVQLLETRSARQVKSWYLQSFEEALQSPSIEELEVSFFLSLAQHLTPMFEQSGERLFCSNDD
jgi:hypothetical protein